MFYFRDPASAFNTFGVAPRVYVGIPQVKQTGLITNKSRVNFEKLYKLPENINFQKMQIKLLKKLKDPYLSKYYNKYPKKINDIYMMVNKVNKYLYENEEIYK